MKKYHRNKIVGLLLLVSLSFSCSSDLDFNQVNTVKLEPAYISNLSYFDVPATIFIKSGVEQSITFDDENFDVFKDSFFRSYLQRAVFSYEINNTINRSFTIDITLLDENDQLLYTFFIRVPAFSGKDTITMHRETFENASLTLLRNTRKMRFSLTMGAGPALNVNSLGSLKLRSSATAYMVIE